MPSPAYLQTVLDAIEEVHTSMKSEFANLNARHEELLRRLDKQLHFTNQHLSEGSISNALIDSSISKRTSTNQTLTFDRPSSGASTPRESNSVHTHKSRTTKLQWQVTKSNSTSTTQSTLKKMRRFIKEDTFDLIVASFIMMNSIVLCCEVQYEGLDVGYDLQYPGYRDAAKDQWPSGETVFLALDWFFGIGFCVELVIRLATLGKRYFFQIWNYLDVLCILAFLLDKGSIVLPISGRAIRVLRLFRLVRLVRLMRYLESLDVMYIMTTAIYGMRSILGWAVLLLTLMLATSALFLTQILHTYYFDDMKVSNLSPEKLVAYRAMYEYFGSFTRCLLSMFEMAMANWPPVTRLLSEQTSEWFMLVCVLHKLTIGFAVIGVVNGVIMQETFKVAATDDVLMLRQKLRAAALIKSKMTDLFNALDISNDGQLDYEEFLIITSNPEVKTWLASMDIETDDLCTLFMLLDSDRSGTISVDELLTRMPRIRGAARGIDMMALNHDVVALTKELAKDEVLEDLEGVAPIPSLSSVALTKELAKDKVLEDLEGVAPIQSISSV